MVNKPIKIEADYKAALVRIDELFYAKPTSEGDELELLITLIEHYEDTAFPIDLPDPVTAIKFRMAQQGLKKKDLVPYIGNESKVSDVLSGKCPLSVAMIRKLFNGLGIPAEVLLQQPQASASRKPSEKVYQK